jgi:flagellar basal body-associated protein FliL
MPQAAKKKKKKLVLSLIIGIYITVIVYSFLFVPVKASIGDKYPETVYGYYPIFKLSQSTQSFHESSPDVPITLKLNITAWVLQMMFITLVFISLLLRTLKHFREH